jgi:hypothetical protein
VIVWACGYATNSIPVYDTVTPTSTIAPQEPRLIPLQMSKGQINVDDQARILVEESYKFQGSPSVNLSTIPDLMTTTTTTNKPTHGSHNNNHPVVENLYGSGLGYGLKATLDNGEFDGSSGRADGVAVYLKRGATLVLAHVLGNKVFGGMGIKSWEERNVMIRKQQFTSAVLTHSTSTVGSSTTSTSTTVGSTSITIETTNNNNNHLPVLHKSLASPKRPLTTATTGGRSVSTGRHSLRIDSSNNSNTSNNNNSNNNNNSSSNKSNTRGTQQTPPSSSHQQSQGNIAATNPLNKSCPESLLRKQQPIASLRPQTHGNSNLNNNNNNNNSRPNRLPIDQ